MDSPLYNNAATSSLIPASSTTEAPGLSENPFLAEEIPSTSKRTPPDIKKILDSENLVGRKRGRGRKPKNADQLITASLTEGIVEINRGIIRRIRKRFKNDSELHGWM